MQPSFGPTLLFRLLGVLATLCCMPTIAYADLEAALTAGVSSIGDDRFRYEYTLTNKTSSTLPIYAFKLLVPEGITLEEAEPNDDDWVYFEDAEVRNWQTIIDPDFEYEPILPGEMRVFSFITQHTTDGLVDFTIEAEDITKFDELEFIRGSIRGPVFPAFRCGDIDKDRDVDSSDLLAFLGNWTGDGGFGMTVDTGDCDGDKDVDSADLLTFLGNWTGALAGQKNTFQQTGYNSLGQNPPSSALAVHEVPEPSCPAAPFMMATLSLCRKRRFARPFDSGP